jgi:hypothetical protein
MDCQEKMNAAAIPGDVFSQGENPDTGINSNGNQAI